VEAWYVVAVFSWFTALKGAPATCFGNNGCITRSPGRIILTCKGSCFGGKTSFACMLALLLLCTLRVCLRSMSYVSRPWTGLAHFLPASTGLHSSFSMECVEPCSYNNQHVR
jgi:hypothetical protein